MLLLFVVFVEHHFPVQFVDLLADPGQDFPARFRERVFPAGPCPAAMVDFSLQPSVYIHPCQQ